MLPVRRLRALHAAVPPDATPPHGGTCCTPRAERGLDVLVRSDSAGASHDFVSAIVSRGFEFSVGLDITEPVREAILKLPGGSWVAPITKEMEEAEVAEANGLLDVSKRPKGARVLVRREQPHPGATYNLFDPNRLCPQALLTNSQDHDVAYLEARHRFHTRVEDQIKYAKDAAWRTSPATASGPTRCGASWSSWPRTCSAGPNRSASILSSCWPGPSGCVTSSCRSPAGWCIPAGEAQPEARRPLALGQGAGARFHQTALSSNQPLS